MAEVRELTLEDFDSTLLESEVPVMVDFWADWCAPCRAIAPLVEQIAQEYEGKLIAAKVDVDACKPLAARYQIMSIPAVFLFKDGKPVAQSMGAVPKEVMIKRFEKHL